MAEDWDEELWVDVGAACEAEVFEVTAAVLKQLEGVVHGAGVNLQLHQLGLDQQVQVQQGAVAPTDLQDQSAALKLGDELRLPAGHPC